MFQRIRELGAPGLWMAIVLPALLLVQGVWLYMTFQLERKRFDSAAREALYRTVETLQMNEAHRLIERRPQLMTMFEEHSVFQRADSMPEVSQGKEDIDTAEESDTEDTAKQYKRTVHFDFEGMTGPEDVDKKIEEAFAELAKEKAADEGIDTSKFDPRQQSGFPNFDKPLMLDSNLREIRMIRQVMVQMFNSQRPLKARLREANIDDVLARQIKLNGLDDIDSEYAYAVVDGDGNTLLKTSNFERDVDAFYSVRLFPNGSGGAKAELQLAFPGKDLGYNWRHIVIMQLSTGLIAIVIWAFMATARNLREQRELSARKTVFINNLSHELKTPITTIGLASDSLRNQLPPDSPYLRIIKEEADRMYRQIERVLQTAELNQRDLLSEAEALDISAFLADRVSSFGPRAEAQDTRLELELSEKLPEITTDRLLLTTAVDNLIDNALKYGGEGDAIIVAAQPVNERLRIAVSDNGPGIDKPQLKQIFEPYYRPQGDRHDVKGFGLGLSQVREIVRLMGGEIKVESTIGRGSTFEIYLPFELPQPE